MRHGCQSMASRQTRMGAASSDWAPAKPTRVVCSILRRSERNVRYTWPSQFQQCLLLPHLRHHNIQQTHYLTRGRI